MLLALGANPAAMDSQGATPLHLAGRPWRGQEGTIAALLGAGAAIHAADRAAQTPLHWAARHGNRAAAVSYTHLMPPAIREVVDCLGRRTVNITACVDDNNVVLLLDMLDE